jgi:hypothetical protein
VYVVSIAAPFREAKSSRDLVPNLTAGVKARFEDHNPSSTTSRPAEDDRLRQRLRVEAG